MSAQRDYVYKDRTWRERLRESNQGQAMQETAATIGWCHNQGSISVPVNGRTLEPPKESDQVVRHLRTAREAGKIGATD